MSLYSIKYNTGQVPCTTATYDAYTREIDHVICHVIPMSLGQENGCGLPDHLLNGGSHFEEVGWVRD